MAKINIGFESNGVRKRKTSIGNTPDETKDKLRKVKNDMYAGINITLDTYSDVFDNFQTENIQKIDNNMSTAGFAMNT